jgi:hypothetical protein
MTASEQLISSVHPALSSDPELEAVIAISPTADAWLEVSDEHITVITDANVAPAVITLAGHTIASLVAALPAGLGASVYAADWSGVAAHALAPALGRTYQANAEGSLRLFAYTAGLWRTMRPIAFGLTQIASDIDTAMRMADIFQSDETWLDLWGLLYNIPRLPGEADAAYRTRIVYTLTLPRANNRALELLIKQALGRVAYVEDGGVGGMFTPNGSGQALGPGGGGVWGPQSYGNFLVTLATDGAEDTAPLIALINSYKAAGTTYTINTLYAPTAIVSAADIVASWG